MRKLAFLVALVLLPSALLAQTGWTPKRMDGTALVILIGRNGTTDTTAYGFSADTNTGMIRLGPDSLALVAGANAFFKVGAGGVPVGLWSSASIPALRLTTGGEVYVGDDPSAFKFGVKIAAANSTAPLVYFWNAATTGTDNQPVLKLYNQYASSSGNALWAQSAGTGPTIYVQTDSAGTPDMQFNSAVGLGSKGVANKFIRRFSNVGDDAAKTIFSSVSITGIISVTALNNSTGASGSAIYHVQPISGFLRCSILAQSGTITFEASTSDLQGTTGTDNRVTLGVTANTLKFENRIGATAEVSIELFGNP